MPDFLSTTPPLTPRTTGCPDEVSCRQSDRQSPWRCQAARVVEELFPMVVPAHWDALLDLRQALLGEQQWERVLDVFQSAREAMEADHYLVFYRLRRLLESHLRLAVVVPGQDEVSLQVLRLGSYQALEKALGRAPIEIDDTILGASWRVVEHSV